jgi:hypothetical protein
MWPVIDPSPACHPPRTRALTPAMPTSGSDGNTSSQTTPAGPLRNGASRVTRSPMAGLSNIVLAEAYCTGMTVAGQ